MKAANERNMWLEADNEKLTWQLKEMQRMSDQTEEKAKREIAAARAATQMIKFKLEKWVK